MQIESSSPGGRPRRDARPGSTAVSPPTTPEGLPLLGRGGHSSARDGACLMEYTSVLAGLRFSDHPSCTAPTLATLARLVNDAISDAARPQLARHAPDLAARPHLTAQQSATVVAGVLSTVADVLAERDDVRGLDSRRIGRLRRQARCERMRAEAAGQHAWVRAGEVLHRAGAARLRMESAIRSLEVIDVPRRDRVLADLLATALSHDSTAEVVRRAPADA